MSASGARVAARIASFLAVIAGLLPFYLAAYPLGRRARRLFAYPFFRGCVFLTGLKVRAIGAPIKGPGTLYVANHVSYLDIPVLASLTDGLFAAKAEVRGWPLFGFLARIGRTVFVSRQAANVARERLEIAKCLAVGDAVFLFPEGSSSDGSSVLPFRPGLLSAALLDGDFSVPVQPVSIVYGPAADGRAALSQDERDRYAWYGDMDLAPHLLTLFGLKERMSVSVIFHEARLSGEFPNRRALAQWAERTVAAGLGRPLPAEPELADVQEIVNPRPAAATAR